MDKLRAKFARWVDEWKLAFIGTGLAFHSWRFCVVVVLAFVFFATLFSMLAFSASFQLLISLPDFGRKLSYLGEMFLRAFGYERGNFADFGPTLIISILQALIIGLIAIVWWKRRRARKEEAAESSTGAQLSKAGIVTGLAVLAGGCPSCGTSLLAPVLGAIFSGSSAAVGNTISWILTLAAILIALFSFKKVGNEAYVIIVSERRRNREKQHKR